MTQIYDAVIIGGGPAGHSSAVRVSSLGGKVALVERDYIGGICTNWGCTPSKAMIESAKVAREVQSSSKYGIHAGNMKINFPEVAARRDQVVLNTRIFITELLKHNKVDLYQGEARIEEPGRIKVLGGKLDIDGKTMHYEGSESILETRNIVIATGSAPTMPPFVDPDDPSVISSNRLITVNELPHKLTIVGGGVIGMEFATIFANLGSQVTIVEYLPRVVALMDPDISEEITCHMKELGVKIYTNHRVTSISRGVLKAENMATHEIIKLSSDKFLIATGREAVVHEETYQKHGLRYTRKGVEVNEYQQTSVPGIWAIGDATGRSILAHVGIQQGIIAAENLMSKERKPLRKMDYEVIPAVVYSLPEMAMVGTVPADMTGVSVVRVPFNINLRANIEYRREGFVKLWIKDNHLLAAQAIGHNVSEIFQEFANMIALKSEVGSVAEIIHIHPSYAEIARSALDHHMGKAVDFYVE